MRTVPRTPKAGSILVARTVGDEDGDEVEDVAETLMLDVGVAIVRVTLNTVGRTVTREIFWAPEAAMVVVVKDDVSLMTVTLGEMVEDGTEELDDCAETEATNEANRRNGRAARQNPVSQGREGGGGNMVGVGRERGHRRRTEGRGACQGTECRGSAIRQSTRQDEAEQ